MPRKFYRAALVGLFGCASGWSYAVSAAELFAASAAGAPVAAAPQWPVLRSPTQSVLGLYGGIVSAYSVTGQLESATLLILPTGYTSPVLSNGSLATFPVAYFDQPECSGREYLAPSANHPGLLPFPGIVYRSPASGQPVYVPQGRTPAPIKVKSRVQLDAQQGIRCESFQQNLSLLAVEANAPATTGMSRAGELGPVSIGVEHAPVGLAGKRDRRTAVGAATAAGGSQADEPPDEPQQECSPGCLNEAVGNGSCDVACNFEACRFDGGDCATMDKDELDKAMANMCSPGCNREDIGDGFCDVACRTEACNQDGGDCDSESQ